MFLTVGFLPKGDGALLDDENKWRIGAILPADELIALMKLDAAARDERQKVRLFNGIEGRMLFKEIGYAVADGCCLHSRSGFEQRLNVRGLQGKPTGDLAGGVEKRRGDGRGG